MKTSSLLRYAAIGMATVGLGMGVAAANEATIENTGPDSTNTVTVNNSQNATLSNNHSVTVSNENDQSASTGSATVDDNTTGGDATSGDAENTNSVSTEVTFGDDCGCPDFGDFFSSDNEGTIENTGPDSTNRITFNNDQTLTVNNNQSVSVSNDNSQNASTGDASVTHNTTGGDATSGSATNNNSTSTTISF